MNVQLVGAAAGAMIVAGLIGAVVALRPTSEAPRPRRGPSRLAVAWAGASSRRRTTALVSVAVGVLLAVATGWVALAVVIPAVAIGLPWLLTPPPAEATIGRLEAMEEWTRTLAGVLALGSGLEQAITISLRSAPAPIRPEVTRLVARLRARWDTERALRAFADDVDDVTGDLIAANLIHAAGQRNRGLAAALEANAAAVKADVASRRRIEAGRAKPRGQARLVTLWAAGFVTLLAVSGDFLTPYKTPMGQIVMIVLIAAFAGGLFWLRKMAEGTPPPRFLGAKARAGAR